MSLSRPARFPVLKLPWLCTKCVLQNSDLLDIIFFACITQKTRRIVKSLRIPLNGIDVSLTFGKLITLGNSKKIWSFKNESECIPWVEAQYKHYKKDPLVLQKNAIPFDTCRVENSLWSYTDGNEITALKTGMEFLDETFDCSLERVKIYKDYYPESGDIGVKSTANLHIYYLEGDGFCHALIQKLNLLLTNLEVTGTCKFNIFPGDEFFCDPKLLKCEKLVFMSFSSLRVTADILVQFDVSRIFFEMCWLSEQDIVSFVTHWFHSDNRKLEYLFIESQNRQISLEKFRDLNPLPISGRNRAPPSESFDYIDFSKGFEIVRHDGLRATIHFKRGSSLFYVWHDQTAIAQY